ncbi:jg12964 [Pararge aegeria aegeria]|uniref:Jg12964 protein n=1 Tax=Pararge aegeria aegeria TaxID=348720 RepID=A0A8S4RV18_9NEOP|nr:jg12964 [Pararge aegeria aegeria]
MDASCIILGCLLMFQMTTVLVLLNPINDVRKSTRAMNNIAKYHKTYYYLAVTLYFGVIAYFGIITPLQKIHNLITNNALNEYEKLIALHGIEKNYFIAGFSLFMIVVLYGIRALVTYASTLLQLLISTSQSVVGRNTTREQKRSQAAFSSENILPNLLRVKRSVSYETTLFANELREQLKTMFRNAETRKNADYVTTDLLQTKFSNLCSN